MEALTEVPESLLAKGLDVDSLAEYIQALDPERTLVMDPANMAMLLPILEHCGYRTIHDLHETLKCGWDCLRCYEKHHPNAGPISGSLAILYAVIFADKACRENILALQMDSDLSDYFLD